MSELAERSGVSAGDDQALPARGAARQRGRASSGPRATWPGTRPSSSSGCALIKRLQEERFMPLKVIRDVLDQARARLARSSSRTGSSSARAARGSARMRAPRQRRYAARTSSTGSTELGVLTPDARGYDADDVQIIEAIVALPRRRLRRAARLHGLRHAALPRGARAAGRGGGPHAARPPRRRGRATRAEIIAAGAEPLRELIGAMHSKLLLAELNRRRSAGAGTG